MSPINKRLYNIFKSELHIKSTLNMSKTHTNLIHNEKEIYCFKRKRCYTVNDINQKFNEF